MGTPLPGAAEKQKEAVYIPGAGSRGTCRDSTRKEKENVIQGLFHFSILSESDFI